MQKDRNNSVGIDSSRSAPVWMGYLLSIMAVGTVTGILLLVNPHLPLGNFPATYVLAVAGIAYFFDLGPALFCFFLGLFAYDYFFNGTSRGLNAPQNSKEWAGIVAYLVITGVSGPAALIVGRSQKHIRGLARDLSARAELLQKSEAQLRSVLDNSTEGLVVSDLNGKLLLWNHAALKMHGLSSLEECLRMLPEFADTFELSTMDGRVLPVDQWPLTRILQGEHLRDLDLRIRRIHDENWERIFSYGGEIVRDENGRPFMALVTVHDITERKLAEEGLRKLNEELEDRVVERTAELTAANKELESFSYSVSHDLRAPLRAIDGFSGALLKNYTDLLDERGKDYLQRVRAAAQRMGTLIDDILNLSRATRVEMRRETVDLSAVAGEIAAELHKAEPDRQVEINIEPNMKVKGDIHLLRIALQNLIGNAWKFTAKRSLASIRFGSMELEGEKVYFIQDNGAGFDMTYVDKLFTPFQRLHTESEFPGTGIGLALIQRIFRRHGGRIWAEGAVDQGATFYFTLREKEK